MNANEREWIDVSRPLFTGMEVYPGDRETVFEQRTEYGLLVTSLAMSAHTGTHMDAPLHFFAGALPIDRIPLDLCVGPARVVARVEDAAGERVLLKGADGLSGAQAEELAARGVRLLGVEAPSIDRMGGTDFPAHRILLGQGVWIVEGLDLARVEPGEYDLICLPLRIAGSDGAPARALLRAR